MFLFFSLFTALLVCARMFARANITVLYSDIGRKLLNFIFLAYTNVSSVTKLTEWVAPPKMACNWSRVLLSRNQS